MGITVLYEGRGAEEGLEAELDIVAIHGLNPCNRENHWIDTWRKPPGINGHLWLRDVIPNSVPTARIMLYKYNSSPALDMGNESFVEEASQFLEALWAERHDHPKRPLILIGHSLGGILIKQALVNAKNNPSHKNFLNATSGLVFMGTPHNGYTKTHAISLGKTIASVVKYVSGSAHSIIDATESVSEFTETLKEHWRHQLESYEVISCYETKDVVVPKQSAILGLSGKREAVLRRHADHSDVCRFDLDADDKEDFKIFETRFKVICNNALKKARQLKSKISKKLRIDILACLKSLKSFANNPRYGKVLREHDETLAWIWHSRKGKTKENCPGFVEWLGNDKGIFWISGKPGAGKSILMKYIHEHTKTMTLVNRRNEKTAVLVRFFFHDLGKSSEKTFSGLLHALLYQLLEQCPNLFSAIYPQFQSLGRGAPCHSDSTGLWSETELERAFMDIQKSDHDVKVLCLVDGLDECGENQSDMIRFLKKLSTRKTTSHPQFKVLCSGRPEIGIEFNTGDISSLAVQDYTSPDITKFARDSFNEACKTLLPGESATIREFRELVIAIVSRAEGVFIWARLVVSELILEMQRGIKGPQLYLKLTELPPQLDELYQTILSKIGLEQRHLTFNYLHLLIDPSPPHWLDLQDKLCEEYPYKVITNLLGMTLGLRSSKESIAAKTHLLRRENKFEKCSETWRSLHKTCRGLIHLPAPVPRLCSPKQREEFCKGKVTIHKTIADSLFAPGKMEKLWEGVDRTVLEGPYFQHLGFLLSLSSTPTAIQLDVLSPAQDKDKDQTHRSPIIKIWMLMLFLLCLNENDPDNASISSTWLPAFAARLEPNTNTSFPRDSSKHKVSQTEYNQLAASPHWYHFEAHALGQTLAPHSKTWQTDLLSVALTYELFSFAKEQIGRKDFAEKPGRPYLHYVLAAAPKLRASVDAAIECTKLLLSNNCSPDRKFSSHTAWEYLLAAMFGHRQCFADHSFEFFCRAALLFLECGANPNQYVKCTPGVEDEYHGSAIHILIATAEIGLPMEKSDPNYLHAERRVRAVYLQLGPVLLKLLTRGADINAIDSEGHSVIRHAEMVLRPAEMDLFRKSYSLSGDMFLLFNFLAHPMVFWKNLKANHFNRLELSNTNPPQQAAGDTEPQRLEFRRGVKSKPPTALEHPNTRSLKRRAEDAESESLESLSSLESAIREIEEEPRMHTGHQRSPISVCSSEETKKRKKKQKQKQKKRSKQIRKRRRRN